MNNRNVKYGFYEYSKLQTYKKRTAQVSASLKLVPGGDNDEPMNEVVGKLTADKVQQFITDWRKSADAEITKSNKSYEEGLKKKFDFVEKKTETQQTQNQTTPTQP